VIYVKGKILITLTEMKTETKKITKNWNKTETEKNSEKQNWNWKNISQLKSHWHWTVYYHSYCSSHCDLLRCYKTQEVEALFRGDGCPAFLDCVFAHNDSWYVTFSNEDEAHRAFFYLRETVRTFQGKPIMVR